MSIFSRVPVYKPKRNVFNLSHERKLTCDFGKLIPIFVADCVPGDVFKNTSEIFMRFSPLIAPVMHRINVYTHFFFVPNRLVMPDWQDFITGNDPDVVLPTFDLSWRWHNDNRYPSLIASGSLADYLGIPAYNDTNDGNRVNWHLSPQMLPFLAYQLIWNEYYRDQNLQKAIDINYQDFDFSDPNGPQSVNDKWYQICQLRSRNWEKDYFTSALPWAQKGNPVLIPVSGQMNPDMMDIVYAPPADGSLPFGYGDGHTMLRNRGANGNITNSGTSNWLPHTDGALENAGSTFLTGGENVGFPTPGIDTRLNVTTFNPSSSDFTVAGRERTGVVDIDLNGTNKVVARGSSGLIDEPLGGTINDLRTAFQIQKWLERNARGGTRYIEQILSHFGVRVPDARLQRPEYIGGGRSPVVISEVLQTGESDRTPQGTMSGHGVSAGVGNKFKYKCLEHGYIIGLMSVMPRTAYQQGVPRHFLRNDKFDFYWPSFANLGEQPVMNQELFYNFNDDPNDVAQNTETFGYQSRYADYKYIPSTVHGAFKNTLSFWHLGRIFDGAPLLNERFIKVNTSTDDRLDTPGDTLNSAIGMHRIFAVTDEDQPLWVQVYNSCKAVRPMPRFAVPGFADH